MDLPGPLTRQRFYHILPRRTERNDTDSGFDRAPWRTLAKVCNTVEADQGVVIQIREEAFSETEILTLKSGLNLIVVGSDKTTKYGPRPGQAVLRIVADSGTQ